MLGVGAATTGAEAPSSADKPMAVVWAASLCCRQRRCRLAMAWQELFDQDDSDGGEEFN
jgi:hypothetical protein